ncbi:MAG: hypothetical protein ACJ79S_09340 [Gemmatimonadaceae bacterium]
MRMIRHLLLAGTALVALAPAAARAQDGRHFIDSWFVGAKGGVLTFWTSEVSHAPATLAGVETMITRSRAALYLSADESMFAENGTFTIYNKDPEDPGSFDVKDSAGVIPVGTGTVRMHNLRRYQASLYAFPLKRGGIRPYLGVGIVLNEVRKTEITNMSFVAPVDSLPQPCCAVAASLESARSTTSAIFTAGVQAQFARASLFGHATIMPENSRFLFGRRAPFSIEGGIRYNIGPSREPVR